MSVRSAAGRQLITTLLSLKKREMPIARSPEARRLFAVASGKGGVGKTLFSAALGVALARAGRKTVLVDADFGGPNMHQVLRRSDAKVNLSDFISGVEPDLERIAHKTDFQYLRIIPGGSGLANLPYASRIKIFRHLHHIDAQDIVLDLGAGVDRAQFEILNRSDVGFLVTIPEPLALQNGFHFLRACLLQSLNSAFYQQPAILRVLSQANDRQPQTVRQLTEQVKKSGADHYLMWKRHLDSFRPVMVLNMSRREDDVNEGLALQAAIRDMLCISFAEIFHVRFDAQLRPALLSGRTDLLFSEHGILMSAVKEIAGALTGGVKTVGRGVRSDSLEPLQRPEEICSVACPLWGRCRAQNGGYPCRIELVRSINQLRRSSP